jgi:RimJ/RimL family protein N-acetyltransferase
MRCAAGPSVPVIATARLVLRGHTVADLDATAAMWADLAATRFIGGRPSSREDAWARLLRYVGHWSLLGFGYWLIEARAGGQFVGEAGFGDFKRDLEPGFAGALEAGWIVTPSEQGKGYASEAVAAALDWAGRHLPGRRSVCMIAPDNAASLQVARKCGYAEYARASYKGEPTLLMERG